MEIEHINDNTIRVIIGMTDLEERGVTVLDLLGNQRQIESFFYSILEEVDVDHRFNESEALTFQVLPNKNGLELYISKTGHHDGADMAFEMDENMQDIMDSIMDSLESSESDKHFKVGDDSDTTHVELLMNYHHFEDLLIGASMIKQSDLISSLFKYKDDYYLQLLFPTESYGNDAIEQVLLQLMEFADETPLSSEYLGEYGQLLIFETAVEALNTHFK